MAGSNSGGDDEVISGINVTPLVDIMLCLLVIFMVTTSYVVQDSIKLDLPEASTGEGTEPSMVMVTYAIDPESGALKLYLNGEVTDEPKLRAHIQGLKKEKKDVQAVIAADKKISHGDVIHIIDVVKQEGILKFALKIESGG